MGKITVGLVSVLAGILAITSVRGQVNYSTLYAIQTIAGSGQYDNIDGTNLDAVFEWPIGITEDTQSNLYVVDEAARTVREIMPMGTNWVVTTIAGSGQFGHVDGIGTNAVFCNLQSISSDAKGNLYVGSGADPSIRMVALVGTNWVVSTIAGSTNGQSGYRDGTNWDALFGTVPIIASDAGGNLFVADFENSLIRKVTPIGTNWVVTTITLSGTGNNPHFSEVTSITVDTHSNLYVTTSSTIEQLAHNR